MKLTVFGSAGHTGRHVLARAAARGHELTAFTRRPEALPDAGVLARVVHGDGRDPDAVAAAITGTDAVIAILAARSPRGPHHIAAIARVITQAMVDAGVRRLVITSAYPIVGSKPRVPIAMLRLVFAANYADARAMERLVSGTDLDWTIARLNRLTNHPARGAVRITPELFDKPSALTRSDAAATLVNLAEDSAHTRTAVNVAGAS